RHTRFSRDWSSDVCSSDLERAMRAWRVLRFTERLQERVVEHVLDEGRLARAADARHADEPPERQLDVDVAQVVLARAAHDETFKIGRASCRERVQGSAVAR